MANNKDIRSSSQTSDQKLIHVFDTTYNAATNPSIGFEYLFKDIKERERNTNGLAVFSSSGIVERFDMETRKYFKTNGADVLIVDKGNNEYNTGDNIENTKYSFFEHIKCVFAGKRPKHCLLKCKQGSKIATI